MSGIAQVLLSLGYKVTGSDMTQSEITRKLSGLGAKIYSCHKKENISGADVVVTSTAILPDNPEVSSSIKRKIPVIPRAEMLTELMRLKYAITVAGTHGKTTTTSIVSMVLDKGKLDPTVIIGGKLINIASHARCGKGEYIVAEADESDGSFLLLTPTIAIVTNIDADHLDYYRNIDNIKDAFVGHINKVPFYGCAIICGDDANVRSIMPRIKRKYYTYGIKGNHDFTAKKIRSSGVSSVFTVYFRNKKLGELTIGMTGMHNVNNALAAVAAGHELEIGFKDIKKALGQFKGVERRLQIVAKKRKTLFIDDYGHHPTEISATLDAIKNGWPGRKLLVIFQPHRYTRTQAQEYNFAKSLNSADRLWITPIYPAGEKPIANVSSKSIMKHFSAGKLKQVTLAKSEKALINSIMKELKPGDILLTLGAGPIWKTGLEIIDKY